MLPGIEDGADGVRAGDGRARRARSCFRIPGYPGLPLGGRARRGGARAAAAARRRPAGLGRGAGGGGRALSQLPVEPDRGVRAGGRLRAKRSSGRVTRARGCCTTSRTATSSSTAAGRRASSRRTARARSGSSCSRCRSRTGWPGWRLGFAVGNAELVARIEDLQNHVFAGVFVPVQEAGIAALTGPQETVEERRALYEARRDRVLAALAGLDARERGHVLRLVPAARTA